MRCPRAPRRRVPAAKEFLLESCLKLFVLLYFLIEKNTGKSLVSKVSLKAVVGVGHCCPRCTAPGIWVPWAPPQTPLSALLPEAPSAQATDVSGKPPSHTRRQRHS